jgi:hypothetical protein
MEMTDAEFRAEMERLTHEAALDRARRDRRVATASAYAKIRARSPGWTPRPLPEHEPPENAEEVTPDEMAATLEELKRLQTEVEE